MNRISLEDALQECRKANSFLVTTHADPDGDAVGSALAVMHFLRALGKTEVVCTCHDPVPRIYDWMPGAVEIIEPDAIEGTFDLVVIIDVAQRERIGSVAEVLGDDQRILVLDHHREDKPCGTVNFVEPTYAAASEIVVDLFEAAGVAMSEDAATCAYVGLTTDTGSFRFGNTDARAHRHAIALLEAGIDAAAISARVFDVMSLPKSALLERVLQRIQVSDCARYAWSWVNADDLVHVDATSEDMDGLVNYVRNIEGIEVGLLFRELEKDRTKVSVRSQGQVSSSEILKPLGGGGHAGAAGATLHTGLDEARPQVLARVAEALGAIAS